jgi:hypothetical protein
MAESEMIDMEKMIEIRMIRIWTTKRLCERKKHLKE